MLIERKSKISQIERYIEILISTLGFSLSLFVKNNYENLKYFGIIIIFISIYLFVKVRKNTLLLLLFGIIAYINISLSLGDLLNISSPLSPITQNWQQLNRLSEYNVVAAKCLLLLMSILNLFISSRFVDKIKNTRVNPQKNDFIFWCGIIVLIIFWVFGYSGSMGQTYQSNTRTIYEYCIIIFIVVWYYSGNYKYRLYLLYSYAIIYILQAVIRGDRSSAFPMVLVVLIITFSKINIKTVITLALVGLLASNIISVYRESYSFSDMTNNYFSRYSSSILTSDTVSQSYYTSIAIAKTGDYLKGKDKYFKDFIIGIFAGGGYRNADVGKVVYNYEMHRGGGMYYSWFYFWFGYLGVIIAGLILGLILRITFTSKNEYVKLFKLGLIAMAFRWYLYVPFVLFRTILFMFILLILISILVNKIMHGKVIW